MEIRMIVCDLDQTLLRSDKEVSAHTLEVLERCRAAGIVIAVATARSESSAARVIRAVRPDVAITSGGAVVRYGDEIVAENLLGVDAANAMVARCLATEGVGYITYRTSLGYFVNREFDRNDVSWQDYENAQLADMNQKIEHNVQKFV
ncbi:MAG: HAD hydrolase family protein, partial [Clostridiales bacterium]|nr:HAD hydrolase family protein [Clostridiales bacterium]